MQMHMTRKCFACICAAKDNMREIQKLASNPAGLSAIKTIADKFVKDFGDVDPSWTPGSTRTAAAGKPASSPAAQPPGTPSQAKPATVRPSCVVDPFKADPNYQTPAF